MHKAETLLFPPNLKRFKLKMEQQFLIGNLIREGRVEAILAKEEDTDKAVLNAFKSPADSFTRSPNKGAVLKMGTDQSRIQHLHRIHVIKALSVAQKKPQSSIGTFNTVICLVVKGELRIKPHSQILNQRGPK